MAEGTSVGTIFLDLRIFSHVKEQLNDIANSANRQAKESFDRVGKTMQESISKPMENLDKVMKKPLESVKAQVKQTSDELDDIVARAMDRLKTSGSVKMETPRVAKLTGSKLASDPTEFMNNWDPVKLKLREVQEEAKNTVLEATKLPKAAEQTAIAFDKVKASVKASGDSVKQNITHTLQSAQKRTKGMFSGVNKGFHRLKRNILSPFKAVFLTAGLYAAFRGLKSLMTAAGEQSKQFTKSLNAVKANLSVAFMPIIQAIMPALNTLMAGLAKVTKSIAAFISGLFGKTYAQSVAAANKLQQVQNKAQKTKGMLAGFDELNVISSQKKDEDGIDYGALDTGGTQAAEGMGAKVKEVFKGIGDTFKSYIFDPIKNNLSKFNAPMAKFKALFKDVGKQCKEWMTPLSEWFQTDFKDALENTVSNSMTRMAGVMDTVAMIAGTLWDSVKPIFDWFVNDGLPMFTEMWVEVDNTFTDAFMVIKEVVDTVWKDVFEPFFQFTTKVWLDVWKTVKDLWDKYGATTFENIRKTIDTMKDIWMQHWEKTLKPIFDKIFEVLNKLWEDHLQPLVAKIGEFIAKLVNGAMEIYNGFIAPVVSWFIDILGPIIADEVNKIVEIVGDVVGVLADVAGSIFGILSGIIDFIVGVFTGDWERAWEGVKDVFKNIWNGIVSIVEVAVNWIVDAVNWMIKGINALSFKNPINGKTIGFDINPIEQVTLPRLANGGVINQPTLAMVGEYANAKNNPEIVTPENKMRDVFAESLAPFVIAMHEEADRVIQAIRSIDSTIQLDGETISKNTVKHINNETRRTGRTPILV